MLIFILCEGVDAVFIFAMTCWGGGLFIESDCPGIIFSPLLTIVCCREQGLFGPYTGSAELDDAVTLLFFEAESLSLKINPRGCCDNPHA